MELKDFFKLSGKGPMDVVHFADLVTLSGDAPQPSEDELKAAREAKAAKRKQLEDQMAALDAAE